MSFEGGIESRNGRSYWCFTIVLIATATFNGTTTAQTATQNLAAISESMRAGDLPQMKSLIASGANVNVSNRQGDTPLFVATQKGYAGIVGMLLEAGADAKAVNRSRGFTALHLASAMDRADIVQRLLKAQPNVDAAEYDGFTPLYLAAQEENDEIVRLLLKAGADINAVDKNLGTTSLLAAAQLGHVEIANLLLNAGART